MKTLWYYKLTLTITLICLYGILMPGDAVPSVGIPGIDKVVHLAMFLAITGSFIFEYLLVHHTLPSYFGVSVLLAGFGLATELMQGLFTDSRAFDLWDLCADCIGIGIALLTWHIIFFHFPLLKDKLLNLPFFSSK